MAIIKPLIQKLWASGGAVVQPSDTKIETGWTAEVPPHQWENWIQNRQDQYLAHINERGIPEWDSSTEYLAGQSFVQGSDGFVYKAKQTHTNQDPTTDTVQTYWSRAFREGTLLDVRVFTASATYTPTVGMRLVIIEVQGGGGAGAGATVPGPGKVSLGAPGSGGAYAKGLFTAADIGASKFVTVGAGGVPTSGADGGAGGTSSVGALIVSPGGSGGVVFNDQTPPTTNGNGSPTAIPTGWNIAGAAGTTNGLSVALNAFAGYGGHGGDSHMGNGAVGGLANSPGNPAFNYGAGGGGVFATNTSAVLSGGAGMSGIVTIWEYA